MNITREYVDAKAYRQTKTWSRRKGHVNSGDTVATDEFRLGQTRPAVPQRDHRGGSRKSASRVHGPPAFIAGEKWAKKKKLPGGGGVTFGRLAD